MKYANELEVLKVALLNEHEGYQFYKLAAGQTDSEEAKEVFESLAAEELKHQQWLTGIYRELAGDKLPSADIIKDTASPGVFTKESVANYGSLSVSALHIGVLMEKASIDYYREAAEKTSIESLKSYYRQLADWEWEHLKALQQAYDFAREDWWEKQGFSPS